MIVATAPDPSETNDRRHTASTTDDQRASRMYLTASDGTRLHCRRWQPGRGETRATVLFLHGLANHGGWFAETAALLVDRGIAVYTPDRRGSGLSGGPRGHLPCYERVVADAELFVDHALREQPGRPLFLAGSGWAANVALALTARRQRDLDGLLLLGPGLFPRIGLSLPQKLLVLVGQWFGTAPRLPIPLYPGLYTRDPRAVERLHDDPLRLLTASARFFWETHRLDRARDRFAAQLDLPVLVQIGAADRVADANATAAWVDRLSTPDRARYVYAGASHTLDFEPEPMVSVYRADLFAWLDEHIGDATGWETYHAC